MGSDLQTIETRSSVYCDAKTKAVALTTLKAKKDQTAAAKKVPPRLENLAKQRIDTVRSEQGGEYMSNEFQSYCSEKGYRLEASDTGEAFQNGLAEVTGGKVTKMMRASECHAGAPEKYCSENAGYQTWLINRVPTRKQLKLRTTPELTGQKADLAMGRRDGRVSS